MKKWTSLALLGLTSATLLVACGSKKEENSSSVKETQTSMNLVRIKQISLLKRKIQKKLNLVQKKQHNQVKQVKQPQRLIQQVVTKLQIHLKWFLQSW